MSKKASTPPPRPPAPKVGGSSISFSFKALEEEEEEELTFVTGKFDKQIQEEKERHAQALVRERSLSKSPDNRQSLQQHMEKSPSIKSQNSFDKLKDFKDKIHSEIQKKKEEIFTDSNITTVKDRKAEKTSLTITKEKAVSLGNVKENHPEDFQSFEDVEDSGEFKSATDLELDDETAYFDINPNDKDASGLAAIDDKLEINEEYFNTTGDDFSDLPGVIPMVRQRKRFQGLRKIKPVVPVAPVSMSKLSKKIPETEAVTEKLDSSPKNIQMETETNNFKDTEAMITIHGTKIPVKKCVTCIIVLFLYMIIPLPSYISGMVIGVMLTSAGWMLYLWVNQPARPREPIPDDLPLDKLPPLPAPEMKEPKGDDCCYKVGILQFLT